MTADGDRIIVTVDQDLEEIVPEFLELTRQDLAKIRQALDAGDLEPARIAGHSLKGSGAGYGFDRLTEIGALIEEHAKAGDAARIEPLAAELQDYLDRVEIRYE